MRKNAGISILLAVLFIGTASADVVELAGQGFIPEPNQEITVQIQTDIPLFCMETIVKVNGDVNIISAMSPADCNQYGWDIDWPIDPYIDDVNNEVYFGGVSWMGEANGIVGYFKFRYNSGQVIVSILDGFVADANCEPVGFSDKTLIFGEPDTNDLDKGSGSSQEDSITDENAPATAESPNDIDLPVNSYWQNKLAQRQKHLMRCPADLSGITETEPFSKAAYEAYIKSYSQKDFAIESTVENDGGQMLMDGEPNIIYINSDITTNQIWTANNAYHITSDINVTALLVVEPGTVIYFGSYGTLHVNNGGTLISCGTPDNPIIYTSDLQEPFPGAYFCAIYVQQTASPATKVTYSYIDCAFIAIVTNNIRLDSPIENNYIFYNGIGIGGIGPHLTDIKNNLIFCSFCSYIYGDGIEIYMESRDGVADANSHILIQNNTCDYQDFGITVVGAADINDAGLVELVNNIITESSYSGLSLVGPNYLEGYMVAVIANTGYGGNGMNKNWDFEEENPVEVNEYPFDEEGWHLVDGCLFIDAGLGYIEETPLIGKTTDINSLPDSNIIDIGFHYPNWNYSNAGQGDYYAGDLDKNLVVDFKDFAILANGWLVTYDISDLAQMSDNWLMTGGPEPNVQIDIYGNGSNGHVEVGISNYTPDTTQAFLLVDGLYAGHLFGFRDGRTVSVNVASLGPEPHQFKIISFDDCKITCSNIKEASFNTPFNYTSCKSVYEANQPLYFCSYASTDVCEVHVEAVDDENDVLWTQVYNSRSANGYVPSQITATLKISQINFNRILPGGASDSVALSTVLSFNPADVNANVRALIVAPLASRSWQMESIRRAFSNCRVEYYELAGSQATYWNMRWFAENRHIDYLVFEGDSHYRTKEKGTLRSAMELADEIAFSCKQSDYPPGSIPSWCVKLDGNFEATCKTIKSMGFHDLVFVYSDSCFSGRLILQGDRLIEGPRGNQGIAVELDNDMTLALGVEFSNLVYQGWYSKISDGLLSTYSKFTRDEFNQLSEKVHSFYEAIKTAVDESEWDRYMGDYPSDQVRLRGRTLNFYIDNQFQ